MSSIIKEIRQHTLMKIAFNSMDDLEKAQQKHELDVKQKVYDELQKVVNTHYFWRYCLDNWSLFDTYNFEYGCIETDTQSVDIYGGQPLKAGNLILNITKDRKAQIFLETDHFLKIMKLCDGN